MYKVAEKRTELKYAGGWLMFKDSQCRGKISYKYDKQKKQLHEIIIRHPWNIYDSV